MKELIEDCEIINVLLEDLNAKDIHMLNQKLRYLLHHLSVQSKDLPHFISQESPNLNDCEGVKECLKDKYKQFF